MLLKESHVSFINVGVMTMNINTMTTLLNGLVAVCLVVGIGYAVVSVLEAAIIVAEAFDQIMIIAEEADKSRGMR